MKNVHKLAVIFAVLTLTAALLTGCQVTSPNDPEFRKDWDESMDEMQKERDEAMEEAAKDWDAWKQEHKNGNRYCSGRSAGQGFGRRAE